jgi:hypothetical protein
LRQDLLDALVPFRSRLAQGQVVFSAEGPCVTVGQAYRKPLCGAFARRAVASLEAAASMAGGGGGVRGGTAVNVDGILTALNSGLLVGQAWAMRRLARRFLFAVKQYLEAVAKPTT